MITHPLADVARYLQSRSDEADLPRLLYYALGFHAGMNGGALLFDEPIEAGPDGPVVPALRRGGGPPPNLPPEVREILDAVAELYGTVPAHLTRGEAPFLHGAGRPDRRIDPASLADYFGKVVEAGRRGLAYEHHPVWPVASFVFQGREAAFAALAPLIPMIRARAVKLRDGNHAWANEE